MWSHSSVPLPHLPRRPSASPVVTLSARSAFPVPPFPHHATTAPCSCCCPLPTSLLLYHSHFSWLEPWQGEARIALFGPCLTIKLGILRLRAFKGDIRSLLAVRERRCLLWMLICWWFAAGFPNERAQRRLLFTRGRKCAWWITALVIGQTRVEAKRTTCREVGAKATGMGVGWRLGVMGGQEQGGWAEESKRAIWAGSHRQAEAGSS